MEYFRSHDSGSAIYFSLLAIFTALTTVATIAIVVPFPSTQGYFNLGDCIVMISGFILGPIGGLVAGGVGSAFADILVAPPYAPVTFVAKGAEGLLVGLLSAKTRRGTKISGWDILGLVLGSIAMLTGYLLGEMFLLSYTFEVALLELITINSIQVIAGSIVTVLVGPVVRTYLLDYLYIPGSQSLETFEDAEAVASA